MPKRGKSHSDSLRFDSVVIESFDNVASVGAGVANTTVQARFPMPCRGKVIGAVGNCSAIGSGGTHSYAIVKGTGTPSGTPSEDTVASANQIIIPATTLVTADTPVTAAPGEFNAIIAKGDLLTLRAVTPASTGSFTNLKISLLIVPIDGDDTNADPKSF